MKTKRAVRNPTIEKAVGPGFGKTAAVVLAVDSAKKEPACVLGSCGQITLAMFDTSPGTGPVFVAPLAGVDLAVFEKLRAYGDDPRPQDPIDTSVGGALTVGAMRPRRIVALAPDVWTGQTTKPGRHDRIWAELSEGERRIVADGGNMILRHVPTHIADAVHALSLGKTPAYSHPIHNMLDAAGLFLFTVGRIGRGARRIR